LLADLDLIYNISSSETIISVDLQGNILSWNKFAETLLGYTSEEVLNKFIPIISQQSLFELEHLINKTKNGEYCSFRTCKKNKFGEELDLIFIVSPIFNNSNIIGASIIIRKTNLLNTCYLPVMDMQKEQKRKFPEIRDLMIINLEKQKTINQLANDSGINWRTVEKHLTYLIGKKIVEEIKSSKYIRIFELTENGRKYYETLVLKQQIKYVKSE